MMNMMLMMEQKKEREPWATMPLDFLVHRQKGSALEPKNQINKVHRVCNNMSAGLAERLEERPYGNAQSSLYRHMRNFCFRVPIEVGADTVRKIVMLY